MKQKPFITLLTFLIAAFVAKEGLAFCLNEVTRQNREQLAQVSQKYAQEFADKAKENPHTELELLKAVEKSASLTEYRAYLESIFLSSQTYRDIAYDGETIALFRALKLGHYEDYYMLVKDVLFYVIRNQDCCKKITLKLIDALATAEKRSSRPETKPTQCFGVFELAKRAVIVFEEPYSYVMHFGYCEGSEVWVYDGILGWHLPSHREYERLCQFESMGRSFCESK